MLIDLKRGEMVRKMEYELVFDDGCNNGFAFPCNKEGELLQSESESPEAHENLRYALDHPEKFERYNKIVERKLRFREQDRASCECGEVFYLCNEFQGACQCPGCSRWYNLFGQELLHPSQWEE